MSAKPVMMTGVIYPMDKMHAPVAVSFVGNAWDPTLSIGGGPIIPPSGGGGGQPGVPTFPIWGPPGIDIPGGPGYPPVAGLPIPPIPPLPPSVEQPQPGDPTTPLPPPPGQSGWPVQPIAVPPYIVVNYPGVGPVIVAPPASVEKK